MGLPTRMSVAEAQQELLFVEQFRADVKEMIDVVEEWERRDAEYMVSHPVVAPRRTGLDPYRDNYSPRYDEIHSRISSKIVRFRELCSRYSVTFSENLLFAVPTGGRNPGPGNYTFSFPDVHKRHVLRMIEMVYGGTEHHFREEQRREAEEKNRPPIPRHTRVWNATKRTVKLLHDTGYLKWIVGAALICIVPVVLGLFGYDPKTILEILKLVPH